MMEHVNLIRFIPESTEEDHPPTKDDNINNSTGLSGEEARAFYEEIIQSSINDELKCGKAVINVNKIKKFKINTVNGHGISMDTGDEREVRNSTEKEVKNNSEIKNFKLTCKHDGAGEKKYCKTEELKQIHEKLLGFSQNGELENLKYLYKSHHTSGLNIDYQDRYGWTALMCAAVAGHSNIVKYLLSKGANKNICTHKGLSAAQLCDQTHQPDCEKLIVNFVKYPEANAKVKKEKYHCDVCMSDFQETSPKEHETSTIHLFNLKLQPKSDTFMIPKSNIGFRIMKKIGWDGEKGLGPNNEGQKFPVKTTLKRDRSCLGSKGPKLKQRITHFGPADVSAVQSVHKRGQRIMSARVVSKLEQKRCKQKDQQWERELRTYMNLD